MIFVVSLRDIAVLILIVILIRSTDWLTDSMTRYRQWFARLTVSGGHGRLFILVEGGTKRFELVAGCRLHVAAKLLCPEFVYYICLLHYVRRTVLILCGKTTMWAIFVSKRPKTQIPLQDKN